VPTPGSSGAFTAPSRPCASAKERGDVTGASLSAPPTRRSLSLTPDLFLSPSSTKKQNQHHRSIDQFVLAKKLGGGYASTVYLAIDRATGLQVAVKSYHRHKLSALNHYQV
jgi:hypothetical protein